jgi:HSP20 family protein
MGSPERHSGLPSDFLSRPKEHRLPRDVSLYRRERLSGAFDRTLVVPMQIDPDRIKAEYNNGLLALFIPRAEQDKPQTIEIR